MIEISIVVCTHNRAELVRRCIESICEQDSSFNGIEVLIVDNNSIDHTRSVVEDMTSSVTLRYIFEGIQGLSNARNRGWNEAHGEYVVYLDDDATIPRHYIELAREIIRTKKPGIFGGPYREYFLGNRPGWFSDVFLSDKKTAFKVPGPLSPQQNLFGANLIVKRSLLQAVGGFSPSLGMRGTLPAYGEEMHLLQKVRIAFPDELIFGHPDLYIHHMIRPEKLNFKWSLRSVFAAGRSDAIRTRLMVGRGPRPTERLLAGIELLLIIPMLITRLIAAPFRWDRITGQPYHNLVSYLAGLAFSYLRRIGNLVEVIFPSRYVDPS